MHSARQKLSLGLMALALGGCTTMPSGPSLFALPGTGKNFEQFRADDYECRQFAGVQTGGKSAQDAATDSGVRSAAMGTAIGAVAGAALGGRSGAAAGAGTGLAVGALAGTGTAQASGYSLQRRYDIAYGQCMYAKGHKIPVSASVAASMQRPAYRPAPPPPPPRR